MENITFLEEIIAGEKIVFAVIDRGNGEFTSMTKAHYDEQQASQETKPKK